jgi:hypothetical protein
MYRRSQSLRTILEIRQEMARQADHDVDLFTELVRSGKFSKTLEVPLKKAKSGSEMKDAESKPDDLGKRSLL